MAGSYDFLADVLVVEVAQLGPDALGGYLADMGATVVKVETPDAGDSLRYAGDDAVGSPEGVGYLHLRWNRGKQSIGLDLRSPRGKDIFLQLAEKADVVVEGLRGGAMDRLGLGFDDLKERNPRIVFCSLSGLGRDGPYSPLGSFGPTFDAFAGTLYPHDTAAVASGATASTIAIGMHSMGLHAALGTLAAVVRARSTGVGALIEVSAAESAAHWLPDGVDKVLNESVTFTRTGPPSGVIEKSQWPRLHPYQASDGRAVYLAAQRDAHWTNFCNAVGRPDLLELAARDHDRDGPGAALWRALVPVFAAKSQAEWIAVFLEHDVPGLPVNTVRQLASDPHFRARPNVYTSLHPEAGPLTLTSTPVRTPAQEFAPAPAPGCGEHTDAILQQLLGLADEQLAALRKESVIA